MINNQPTMVSLAKELCNQVDDVSLLTCMEALEYANMDIKKAKQVLEDSINRSNKNQ